MATWATSRWAKTLHRLLIVTGLLAGSFTAQAATATRTSAFDYDPVSGLITKEIIEPGDSNLCLVTEYTYDAYGNKLTATTRNCNGSAGSVPGVNGEAAAPAAGSDAIIVARTSSSTYDTNGRFPLTSTNALGQTETKQFDQRFGVVASLTGPNQLTTTWTYDSFGRALTESRADGTSTSTSYSLCSGACTTATSNAQYKITTTQSGTPTSTTYYDMYSRAIQSETQDMAGATLYSRTEYDDLGRVSRTSRPSKSTSQFVWTTVEYDTLNRPYRTTSPNNAGASVVNTVSYNGYTTIATNAKGQTKTEVKNSQGQLVSVTNAYSKTISYQYDAFGNLIKTTDAANNITTITYDLRGRKTAMSDLDQGAWSYIYDVLGQLKKQTDAKAQVVTFQYDKLGRMTQRNEPDLVSTWTYDTCDATLNSGGKCIGKPVKETADNGYIRTYVYDNYGRATAEVDNVDTGYGVAKSFDSYGRVDTLVYPNGFSTRNIYSTTGYLTEVRNTSSSALYWQANTTDNEGNLNQYTYGNSIVNNRTYNAYTGMITQASAGAVSGGSNNGSVSNQTFVYDNIGNLTQRYDAVTGLNEGFGYDNLNRLTSTSAQVGSGTLTQVSLTYDDIGNIKTKSDVGTYTYGSSKPHAVTQIIMNDGVTVYANYTYDANGNMLTGSGRTAVWNSWNMPNSIVGTTQGKSTPTGTPSSSFGFIYNSAHERVKETLPDGTIIYNISPRVDTGIHVEKRVKADGTILYVNSLYASNMPFGTVTVTTPPNNGTVTTQTRYFHTDHLGSIIAITNESGAVTERRSYDAWGKHRNLDGTSMTNAFVTPLERHGFTGHEEMDDIGLVHMNGRIYDPAIGRFMSADPFIQYPSDLQSYNRYSYIQNNPLSSTDPSGHFNLGPISDFFDDVLGEAKRFVKSVTKSVTKAANGLLSNNVLRVGLTIGASISTYGTLYGAYMSSAISTAGGAMAITGAQFASASFVASVVSGAGAGFVAGYIGSGGNITFSVQAAVAGAISGGVTGYFSNEYSLARVASESIAGGINSKINGKNFREGFFDTFKFSAVTYIAVSARQFEMNRSQLTPGQVGDSPGFRGIAGKLGGGRIVEDKWNKMFGSLDPSSGNYANNLSEYFSRVDKSPLGGHQGGEGYLVLFGQYTPGGVIDQVVEAFAGVHDALNHPWFYNPNGTAHTFLPNLGSVGGFLEEVINGADVFIATPVVGMSVVPDSARWALANSRKN